jgi:hypothetical protein
MEHIKDKDIGVGEGSKLPGSERTEEEGEREEEGEGEEGEEEGEFEEEVEKEEEEEDGKVVSREDCYYAL